MSSSLAWLLHGFSSHFIQHLEKNTSKQATGYPTTHTERVGSSPSYPQTYHSRQNNNHNKTNCGFLSPSPQIAKRVTRKNHTFPPTQRQTLTFRTTKWHFGGETATHTGQANLHSRRI